MDQFELVAKVSNKSERFNENLINYRNGESCRKYIEEACKSLCIIPNIEYLGMEIETDETKQTHFDTVNIDESRLDQVTIHFRVTLDKESELVDRTFYVPKLINDKFIINGTRYYPIYQIVDNGIFVTSKIFSLKTALMPIRFNFKKEKILDDIGNEIEADVFRLALFKQQISYLYYFFAKFGYNESLEYFGFDTDEDIFLSECDISDAEEQYGKTHYLFTVPNGHVLFAKKKSFTTEFQKSFLISLVSVLTENKKFNFGDEFFTIPFWKKVLGKIFTVSNQESKAEKILFSLERIVDNEAAKERLDELEEEDKKDIYSVLFWMVRNFDTLKYHDNRSLKYKRIQCWEFLLQPLLEFFSNATYRLNNTRNMTIKTLTGIFNIGPNFLIKRLLNNELLRYSDAVNDLTLFNTSLRVTFKGKGSITGGSGAVSDKYRESHGSYIGNLSLVAASAGDPGLSTTVSPFSNIEEGRFTIFADDEGNVDEQ